MVFIRRVFSYIVKQRIGFFFQGARVNKSKMVTEHIR